MTMTLAERVQRRREEGRSFERAQTVRERTIEPVTRLIPVHILIACDKRQDMRSGHAKALREWIARDPSLGIEEPTIAKDTRVRPAPRDRTDWTPERIKAVRTAMQMSQTDFAVAVGVSTATIQNWENGRAAPRREMHSRLTLLERVHLPGAAA